MRLSPLGLKSSALTIERELFMKCLSGAMDSASDFGSGGWGFESPLGLFLFLFLSYLRSSLGRVVKELVLKANGLCPREFKSRRCRFLQQVVFT